jgi:hypothetical protein
MNYSMAKVYIVRSHFENYESTTWKIIGLFTTKRQAQEIAKKWEDFYLEKSNIFNEPKGWTLSEKDIEYGNENWEESEELAMRRIKYAEIIEFHEIVIEEFELDKDRSLEIEFITDDMLSLMTQWDRNYKLEKIIK